MIKLIPNKVDRALILLHSADQSSKQFEVFRDRLAQELPSTYILAEDGPISGSPVIHDGCFYGTSDKRYWFMFPMEDAKSQESFLINKAAQGASLLSAAAFLNKDIDKLRSQYGLESKKIVICGFQHGSCLALSTAMMRKEDPFAKVILIQPYLMEALYLEKENVVEETKIICIENKYMREKTFKWIGKFTEKEFKKMGLNTDLVIKEMGNEELTVEIMNEVIDQVIAL